MKKREGEMALLDVLPIQVQRQYQLPSRFSAIDQSGKLSHEHNTYADRPSAKSPSSKSPSDAVRCNLEQPTAREVEVSRYPVAVIISTV